MKTKEGQESRRRNREMTSVPVGLVSKVGEGQTDAGASTVNISLSGVRVRTKLTLAPKQEVQIVIGKPHVQSVPGRVVWVRKDPSGPWSEAGIRFES